MITKKDLEAIFGQVIIPIGITLVIFGLLISFGIHELNVIQGFYDECYSNCSMIYPNNSMAYQSCIDNNCSLEGI